MKNMKTANILPVEDLIRKGYQVHTNIGAKSLIPNILSIASYEGLVCKPGCTLIHDGYGHELYKYGR